jgi:hypothetical protein
MKTERNQHKTKKQNNMLDSDNNENPEINEPGEIGYNSGDDAIEIEMGEGEKIVYGSTFSPKDGDLGDESEDIRDLPVEMRKGGNRYDPTLSTGRMNESNDLDELEESIHITDEDHVGMAYGEDKYVDGDEDEDGNEDSIH